MSKYSPDEKKRIIEYLDKTCESMRDHPVFGIGGRLLDWRNNLNDREKLMSWVQEDLDLLNEPCEECGETIYTCWYKNPDTNHYCFVLDDDGEVIGETQRLVGDRMIGGIDEPENKVVYVPFHLN